jgi:undecaprenyl diphosphate synthase
MDGNRRWAAREGLFQFEGHRKGAENIKPIVEFCLDKGIQYLSLYTFSLENFKRSALEKEYLFELLRHELIKFIDLCLERNVRIRFIGDRSFFPSTVIPTCDRVERETAHCTALNLNFMFCYGSRQEIVSGVKNIIAQVKAGELTEDQITESTISNNLGTAGMPDPEIYVRTGGQRRLSNFMLFQAAYSELYFLDCYWPELKPAHLEEILLDFAHRKRNFGS